jgi:hypothetical protein
MKDEHYYNLAALLYLVLATTSPHPLAQAVFFIVGFAHIIAGLVKSAEPSRPL